MSQSTISIEVGKTPVNVTNNPRHIDQWNDNYDPNSLAHYVTQEELKSVRDLHQSYLQQVIKQLKQPNIVLNISPIIGYMSDGTFNIQDGRTRYLVAKHNIETYKSMASGKPIILQGVIQELDDDQQMHANIQSREHYAARAHMAGKMREEKRTNQEICERLSCTDNELGVLLSIYRMHGDMQKLLRTNVSYDAAHIIARQPQEVQMYIAQFIEENNSMVNARNVKELLNSVYIVVPDIPAFRESFNVRGMVFPHIEEEPWYVKDGELFNEARATNRQKLQHRINAFKTYTIDQYGAMYDEAFEYDYKYSSHKYRKCTADEPNAFAVKTDQYPYLEWYVSTAYRDIDECKNAKAQAVKVRQETARRVLAYRGCNKWTTALCKYVASTNFSYTQIEQVNDLNDLMRLAFERWINDTHNDYFLDHLQECDIDYHEEMKTMDFDGKTMDELEQEAKLKDQLTIARINKVNETARYASKYFLQIPVLEKGIYRMRSMDNETDLKKLCSLIGCKYNAKLPKDIMKQQAAKMMELLSNNSLVMLTEDYEKVQLYNKVQATMKELRALKLDDKAQYTLAGHIFLMTKQDVKLPSTTDTNKLLVAAEQLITKFYNKK